jgi:uncharacterized membrane protein
MAQQTRNRLIVANIFGLLFFIAAGMYFHNVLESIVICIIILLFVDLRAITSSRKNAELDKKNSQQDRDEGLSRL